MTIETGIDTTEAIAAANTLDRIADHFNARRWKLEEELGDYEFAVEERRRSPAKQWAYTTRSAIVALQIRSDVLREAAGHARSVNSAAETVMPGRRMEAPFGQDDLSGIDGRGLAAWRTRYGMSQERLARSLGVAGNTVARWERGVLDIPPYLHLALERLAHTLDYPEPTHAPV